MSAPTAFSAAFQAFAAECSAAAIQQQDLLNGFLGTQPRQVDLSARMLVGGELALGGVTGLGSFSHLSQTWLWIWDNPAFTWTHAAVMPLRTAYRFGEKHDIPELTTGHLDLSGFPNPHGAATILAIVSSYVLGGQGVWSCRINDGKGSSYMNVDDPQVPVARFDPATAPALLMRAAEVWPAHQRAVARGLFRHYNLPSAESPEQLSGRAPDGTTIVVAFDPAGRITGITG